MKHEIIYYIVMRCNNYKYSTQKANRDPEEPVKIICQKASNYVNISGPCPQEPPTRNGRLLESLHKNNAKLEELLSTTVSLAFKYCRSAARTAYQPLN